MPSPNLLWKKPGSNGWGMPVVQAGVVRFEGWDVP